MREISLTELLEAGCHFGHVATRQNPKAREFIFEERDNVHIIDLAKTKEGLEAAAAFIKALASRGGTIIFVGTKRQAQDIIKENAERAGVFYVTRRWVGGTISNFSEVAKNFKKLKDLRERLQNEGEKAKYTKKEVGQWAKELVKLEAFYSGICDLEKLPDALFIVDTHSDALAVKEAAGHGIAVVGIVDTNADPTLVDYPIPANDDAVGSIKLITNYIADAWLEGKKGEVKDGERKPRTAKKTA